MTLGKSEALVKGEEAVLRRALAIAESKVEKFIEAERLTNRKLLYAERVGEDSKNRIERLEGDKTVLIFLGVFAIISTNILSLVLL